MSRITNGFLLVAGRIMPRTGTDWFAAMQAEIEHLPPGAARSWAFGCVVAAIKLRLSAMQVGTLRIPRWVMLVEAVGSFLPLTLGWYAIAFGQPGVLRQPLSIIDLHYLPYPGGPYIMTMLFSGLVVGLMGPVGLFLGLRYVFTRRGLGNRVFGYALIGVPLLYAVVGVIAGYLAGPPGFSPIWPHTIAFLLLPVACVAHLMYLATTAPPADASLAT